MKMVYENYQDWARLEYGRLLWKSPRLRQRLIRHWTDNRHPYRERFARHRQLIEKLLSAQPAFDDEFDAALRCEGLSLRALVREIPPVFGAFWSN